MGSGGGRSRQGIIAPEAIAYARDSPDVTLVSILETVATEALRSGDDRMAERLFRAALKVGSRLPGVSYNLGNIAARDGRFGEAIEFYSQAIEFDPNFSLAYYNRGIYRRCLDDEIGARSDIAAGIERGFDGVLAHAALLRGCSADIGEPAEAFERADFIWQALVGGDLERALMLMELENQLRHVSAGRGLRGEVALLIALENELDVRRHLGDVDGAVAVGAELVELSGRLADLRDDAWDGMPAVLRVYAVNQLPRRLIAMISLYARVGCHEDALAAAAQAQMPRSPWPNASAGVDGEGGGERVRRCRFHGS
jgi:tetratricopeptide (TPR) repeat protein